MHGCWAADRPTADFKRLAAAQHPEALGDPATWAVAPPEAEVAVDTLDLAGVAIMLARGELSLAEPWLLLWKDGEAEADREAGSAATAAPPPRHRQSPGLPLAVRAAGTGSGRSLNDAMAQKRFPSELN